MRHYKIATQRDRITLYRRRFRILWFVVESKRFVYSQHAADIIKRWCREYRIVRPGKDNRNRSARD